MEQGNKILAFCGCCGEAVGKTQNHCLNCRTKDGRDNIFNLNKEAMQDNINNSYAVPKIIKEKFNLN